MANKRVEWHSDAIDDLIEHDTWRVSQQWEPIAIEIMTSVNSVLAQGDIFPRHVCRVYGEPVPVERTWVEVRSKRFVVYFLQQNSVRLVRRFIRGGVELTLKSNGEARCCG